MNATQWQLQEDSLLDLYQIEGLDEVDVYYDIEHTKTIDPMAIALSAVSLVLVKIAEHLIADIYKNLKGKFKRILRARRHAAKPALDITIAIQDGDSFVILEDKVQDDAGIERLMERAESLCKRLRQGSARNVKRLTRAELSSQLSKMPRLRKTKNR